MLVCIPVVMLNDNYMRWSMANKKKPYFYDLSVCRKSMFLKQTSNSLRFYFHAGILVREDRYAIFIDY